MDGQTQSVGENRYLAFSIGTEQFAIPLLKVREVIALTETTPLPQAPAYFRGVMNLRGQVISIIDLRMKLKLSKGSGSETSVIIIDINNMALGVTVDSVDNVMALKAEDISEPPNFDLSTRSEGISGIARKDKKLICLVDLDKTLGGHEIGQWQSQAQGSQKAA